MEEVLTTGTARAAELSFDAAATTAASLELNGVPCVRAVIVRAYERLHGTVLHLTIDGQSTLPYAQGIETMAAGSSLAVDTSAFVLPVPILNRSTERESIDLVATLQHADGRILATGHHRLVVVPASHWCGLTAACEALASFVTPNSPALRTLLLAASARLEKRTGNGALDGCISRNPERVQRIAEACYEALAERNITYILAMPSFEEAGQKVRMAADVLGDGAGNCLDLSVTLAAMLESAGLSTVIALGDAHAVVGFATGDDDFADAVHDGPSRLVNRIELGEFRVIEATGACAARLSFGDALASGERFVREATESLRVLDVAAARRAGFHPLPERLEAGQQRVHTTRRTVESREFRVVQPTGLPPLPKPKRTAHELRLEGWRKRLLDLTRRNRLLNDREKSGIGLLIENETALATLEDLLWNEKPMKLVARGSTRGAEAGASIAELERGWMRSTHEEAELFKRATKAYRDGKSSLEETGARSLYVAVGFLEYRDADPSKHLQAPLLLVPVEMERISRSEGFRVVPVAEDTVPNAALVEYLRDNHGLDLALAAAISEDEHGIDVPMLLARVRKAVVDVPGARVLATAKLGNYSFKKLPIFEEMRARATPLLQHPVVRSLLDRSASESIRRARLIAPEEVEKAAPFKSVRLPLAADSSQIAAIVSAAAGATFVLQGPPGTGKSQTITNLLCESLARGQRVLFIAEKSAALEVVSERLRKVGLGSFALDLHADHATKPSFVAQIKQSLDELEARAAPRSRQFSEVAAALDQVRERLTRACAALHGARGNGMTAQDAIERCVQAQWHRGGEEAALTTEQLLATALDGVLPAELTAKAIELRLDAVAALAGRIDELAEGTLTHLGDFSLRAPCTAEVATASRELAQEASQHAAAAARSCTALAAMLGVTPPRTITLMSQLLALARALLETEGSGAGANSVPSAAFLVECALASDHAQRQSQLRTALSACAASASAETELSAAYDRAVVDLPLATLMGDLRATREKFVLFRWLSARKARAELVRVSKSAPPRGHQAVLDELERLHRLAEAIRLGAPHAATLTRFAQPDGRVDFKAIEAATVRADAAAALMRSNFPNDSASIASHAPNAVAQSTLPAVVDALATPLELFEQRVQELERTITGTPAFLAKGVELSAVRERLDRLAAHAAELPAWSACTVARAAANEQGLAAVVNALFSGALSTQAAEHATEAALLLAWTRSRLREEIGLSECASDKMDALRKTLLTSISEYRKGAADAVATQVRDRARAALDAADDDEGMRRALRTVQELRALTTIRRPIRRVMLEGAAAIAAIKPIVLASPLSATTLLPAEFPLFDLVVFDEASQVPVWDAACAISRGKASVIVGDSKQLPPTNFFDRKDSGEGDAASNEAALADALEPLDSVLEESIASGIPQRSLLWHYRSRDERLIEFSNRKSYGGRLQTFPSPHAAHPNLGVEFRFVSGVYDRGGTATNRAEAEAVVAELVRRLLDDDACTANRSIGVVTFSEAQQTLVQDLFDEAVDKDGKLRERVAEAAALGDGVFIKNLENVQGDERATMLFSICYGRDASGALYHNFGPLNLSGGERRLNVAVTRAREKVMLFSSIRASELDPAKCISKGAQDLRDYLAFAEFGTVPTARESGTPPREIDVSAVERALASALEARGWKVDLHVGRSREYRVSLGLAKRTAPERWVLGVELDGAFYAAAPTSIDREVVRDGVLSALGWQIIRVSCMDWLRDPKKVVDRIDAAARTHS